MAQKNLGLPPHHHKIIDVFEKISRKKKEFLRYANRLHSGVLTLQCQKKGSMGERSKPALC